MGQKKGSNKTIGMKRLILFTIAFYCFLFQNADAQVIIAGQNTGPFIYFIDIEDVFVSDGTFCLDINQDDSCDLKFVSYYNTFHTGYEEGIYVNAMGNAEICNYTDEQTWAIKYYPGDTIGESCFWSSDHGFIWSHTWDLINGESYQGRWNSGDGYLGFRIQDEFDTIVGWCRIHSYNARYITIYDYAFYSKYTSLNDPTLPQLVFVYNSVVRDDLMITIKGENEGSYRYQCLDVSGKEVVAGSLYNGSNEIHLAFLPRGIYFLRIFSGNNVKTVKFLME
jgi:hypothetical protein